MTPDGRYLCSGISWTPDGPSLSLATPGGVPSPLPLRSGIHLGFDIPGPPGKRHCLGFHRVYGPDQRDHVICPRQTTAERGYQCGPCFARDDFRFMHDVHRSGIAPPGLHRYLAQEHWLYVATFADGATKVGTASNVRKWHRLTEQGAVRAQYVALADDGRVVRVLEDAVTENLGLRQSVRSAAKTAALGNPLTAERLDRINTECAESVRELLIGGLGVDGYQVVVQRWEPPSSWVEVLAAGAQLYPYSLESGEHGFTVNAVLGGCALVLIAGSEIPFLADLSGLRGRRITVGAFSSMIPDVQEPLF